MLVNHPWFEISVLAASERSAGKNFKTWPEMIGNVIPFISGEEEKSEQEPLRIWGSVSNGEIVPAAEPKITCQCVRVPILYGHTAAVFLNFRKKPTREQLIEKLWEFIGLSHNTLRGAAGGSVLCAELLKAKGYI